MKKIVAILSFFLTLLDAQSQLLDKLDRETKQVAELAQDYKNGLDKMLNSRSVSGLEERLDSLDYGELFIIEEYDLENETYRIAELYFADSLNKKYKYPTHYFRDGEKADRQVIETRKSKIKANIPAIGNSVSVEYVLYGDGSSDYESLRNNLDPEKIISPLQPTVIWYQGCVRNPYIYRKRKKLGNIKIETKMLRILSYYNRRAEKIICNFKYPEKLKPKILSIYIGE